MNYDWSWGVFLDPSLDGTRSYLQMLFVGVGWTLTLAACAWTIALLLGSLVGTLRCVSHKPLKFIATLYVEVFRNIPLLVQLFLWYFVLPNCTVAASFSNGRKFTEIAPRNPSPNLSSPL